MVGGTKGIVSFMTANELSISFRKMTLEDIDMIMEVEKSAFSLPWSRDAFINEIINNTFATYFVATTHENEVIGYCGAWLIIDEAHITNIALLPDYRGKKIGEALLAKMMDYSRERGCRAMTLEVRVTNFVAQKLYRKLGFLSGGIRKGYYTDNGEDALVMWVEL